jgi:hypothetical protein
MIRSFQVKNSTPQEFIAKITQALSGRDLGKIVSMTATENQVNITFSKLGKSEVIFSLAKENADFSCTHQSEKIALTHKALRGDIESKLAKVLESAGASVTQG